jgi:hypothetical protein
MCFANFALVRNLTNDKHKQTKLHHVKKVYLLHGLAKFVKRHATSFVDWCSLTFMNKTPKVMFHCITFKKTTKMVKGESSAKRAPSVQEYAISSLMFKGAK